MSTYLYLQCLSHDPVLKAEGESGQHTYNLPDIRFDIANRAQVVERYNEWSGYGEFGRDMFAVRTASFLSKHPDCEIGIISEYGDSYDIEGTSEKPMPSRTIEQFCLLRLDELENFVTNSMMAAGLRTSMYALITTWRHMLIEQKNWPVLLESPPTIEKITSDEGIRDSLNRVAFQMNQQIDWMTRRQYVERFGKEAPTTPFVKELAANWSNHRDYKKEWAL